MRSALILLCLYLAFDQVQCGLFSPEDLTPTCKNEAKKIATCASMVPSLSLIDDMPSTNKSENLALISGIHQVLACTGQMYCSSSMLVQSYLRNQEWILIQWHGELEECLVDNDVYSQIINACRNTGPDSPIPDCEALITKHLKCALEELNKRSDVCSEQTKQMLSSVFMASRASCYIENQLAGNSLYGRRGNKNDF